MTRVEREEVEHTVETVTVETVHCDICGGEAETYSTFDIGNETKHAHEDCLKTVAHASPIDSQPNHEENDDTALPIIPPVIQAFFDSDIPKTVV